VLSIDAARMEASASLRALMDQDVVAHATDMSVFYWRSEVV